MNKTLKFVLMILFFPITLTYLIWKQKWSKMVKVVATIALWIFFINAGSSSPDTQNSNPSPTPTQQEEQKPGFTLEQKQEDFKKFYSDYSKRGAILLLAKTTIVSMASTADSREELYLSLDKVGTLLGNAASFENALAIPDSLKEYKDLGTANMYLQLTATAYRSAVKDFQKYLDKNDLKALKAGQDDSQRGDQNLQTSSAAIEKVAKELQVDTSQIKVE